MVFNIRLVLPVLAVMRIPVGEPGVLVVLPVVAELNPDLILVPEPLRTKLVTHKIVVPQLVAQCVVKPMAAVAFVPPQTMAHPFPVQPRLTLQTVVTFLWLVPLPTLAGLP